MRENGSHARHKRRYKVTTDSKHTLPVADNLLARNFTLTAPNRVWTSDITYVNYSAVTNLSRPCHIRQR